MKFSKIKSKVLDTLFPLRKEVQQLRDKLLELQVETRDLVTEERFDERTSELESALDDFACATEFDKLQSKAQYFVEEDKVERMIDERFEHEWNIEQQIDDRIKQYLSKHNEGSEEWLVELLAKVALQRLTDEGRCSVSHRSHTWVRT